MSGSAMGPNQLALFQAGAEIYITQNRGLHILPYYLGGWFDTFLLGVTLMQFSSYLRFIRTDKKHIIMLVFLSVLMTLVASGVVFAWLLQMFVWSFGRYLTFSDIKWHVWYVSIDASTTFIVQAFYVDRACRLYRHWWPALVVGPIMIGSVAIVAKFLRYIHAWPYATAETFADPGTKSFSYGWMGSVLCADLLITILIIFGLRRNRTGWKHTDSILKRLVLQCIESQVPALISAIVVLIVWNEALEVTFMLLIVQTKIYVLGPLATLHLRLASPSLNSSNTAYRSTGAGAVNDAFEMSTSGGYAVGAGRSGIGAKDGESWTSKSALRPGGIEVEVHVDSHHTPLWSGQDRRSRVNPTRGEGHQLHVSMDPEHDADADTITLPYSTGLDQPEIGRSVTSIKEERSPV